MPNHLDWLIKRASTSTPSRLKVQPSGLVTFAARSGEVSPGRMAIDVVISTPRLDHSRDVVVGTGIDTSVHQSNPLVLMNHAKDCPIARATSPDGVYSVKTSDERTTATSYFAQNSLVAEQAFRLAEAGLLNGASVGISTQPGGVEQFVDQDRHPYCVIKQCTLMEYSHVFFPDNPESLVVAIQKSWGGKPLVESLSRMIRPLLPPKRRTVVAVPCRPASWRGIPLTKEFAMTVKLNGRRNKDADMPTIDPTAVVDAVAEETPQIPLGAQLLQDCYEMALGMSERIEEVFAQLEPETQDAMSDLPSLIESAMTGIADKYSERYPDLDPLGGMDDDADDSAAVEVDAESEPADDSEDEDEKQKRWRGPSRKRIVAFWRARQKKLSKSANGAVMEAADHLDDAATATEWTRQYKAASRYHAKALRALCKEHDDDDEAMNRKSATKSKTPDLSSVAALLEQTASRVAETSQTLTRLGV